MEAVSLAAETMKREPIRRGRAMRLPKFEYFAPKTLEAALSLLCGTGRGRSCVGGRNRCYGENESRPFEAQGHHRSDGIEGLDEIHFDAKEGLTIGATARLAEVASHPDILNHYPALASASSGNGQR